MPMRQRLEDQLLETKCCRLAAKRVSEPSVPGEISVAGTDTITVLLPETHQAAYTKTALARLDMNLDW